MKEKVKMCILIVAVLVMAHLILVAGCGKNPISSALFSGGSIEVVRM